MHYFHLNALRSESLRIEQPMAALPSAKFQCVIFVMSCF